MAKKKQPIIATTKARRNRVAELWFYVPETYRKEIMSAIHTFIPAFVGSLIISFQVTGEVSWTRDAIIAIIFAAARAGFKSVSVYILSRVLPDPKAS